MPGPPPDHPRLRLLRGNPPERASSSTRAQSAAAVTAPPVTHHDRRETPHTMTQRRTEALTKTAQVPLTVRNRELDKRHALGVSFAWLVRGGFLTPPAPQRTKRPTGPRSSR